ncbi:hypothetical protein ElyMa_000676700 [Elysia marginata]|uniref:Uncharacterized protein n=1 Tax=Elysia marginata TaxID=1093978 RepID=A0AAV4GGL3_9GAST|nr:hypothetical protein ElyMa_000676700 [Elysia marginata]
MLNISEYCCSTCPSRHYLYYHRTHSSYQQCQHAETLSLPHHHHPTPTSSLCPWIIPVFTHPMPGKATVWCDLGFSKRGDTGSSRLSINFRVCVYSADIAGSDCIQPGQFLVHTHTHLVTPTPPNFHPPYRCYLVSTL